LLSRKTASLELEIGKGGKTMQKCFLSLLALSLLPLPKRNLPSGSSYCFDFSKEGNLVREENQDYIEGESGNKGEFLLLSSPCSLLHPWTKAVLVLRFSSLPESFTYFDEVGYEIVQNGKTESSFRKTDSFLDAFSQGLYRGEKTDSVSFFYFSPNRMSIYLYFSFSLPSLEQIRIVYGDTPVGIEGVYFGRMSPYGDYSDIFSPKKSLEARPYHVSSWSFPFYSEEGYPYTLSFFRDSFVYEKEDKSLCSVTKVTDKDGYFNKGRGAHPGDLFRIVLSFQDQDSLVLLEVRDTLPPKAKKKEEEELRIPLSRYGDRKKRILDSYLFIDNSSSPLSFSFLPEEENIYGEGDKETEFCFAVVDASGNKEDVSGSYVLVDDVAPKVSCLYDHISLSPNTILSKEDVLGFFLLDSSCPYRIVQDTYSSSQGKEGNFEFSLFSKDGKGNETISTLRITVSSLVPPYRNKGRRFYSSLSSYPSLNEIQEELIRAGEICSTGKSFSLAEGEDYSCLTKPGTYYFGLLAEMEGQEEYVPFSLTLALDKKEEEKKGFLGSILCFFRSLFSFLP